VGIGEGGEDFVGLELLAKRTSVFIWHKTIFLHLATVGEDVLGSINVEPPAHFARWRDSAAVDAIGMV
jgi:hypothetical protein